MESVGKGVYDVIRRGFASISESYFRLVRENGDTTENAILQCMDCALGWGGVTTNDFFNGFYGVVSCNCETRNLCSMIARRM